MADGEAQPRSGRLGREEGIEYPIQYLGGDTSPVS